MSFRRIQGTREASIRPNISFGNDGGSTCCTCPPFVVLQENLVPHSTPPGIDSHPHAQHLLLNGHSLHCHPTTGWSTPASIARSTSAAIRNSLTFAARSRVVQ